MNIKNQNETLLNRLREIVSTMRRSGRKPLRIHLTYGMLQALRVEVAAIGGRIDVSNMKLFDIPLQIGEPGSGLWVSCMCDGDK
jgi:hypothetical protein